MVCGRKNQGVLDYIIVISAAVILAVAAYFFIKDILRTSSLEMGGTGSRVFDIIHEELVQVGLEEPIVGSYIWPDPELEYSSTFTACNEQDFELINQLVVVNYSTLNETLPEDSYLLFNITDSSLRVYSYPGLTPIDFAINSSDGDPEFDDLDYVYFYFNMSPGCLDQFSVFYSDHIMLYLNVSLPLNGTPVNLTEGNFTNKTESTPPSISLDIFISPEYYIGNLTATDSESLISRCYYRIDQEDFETMAPDDMVYDSKTETGRIGGAYSTGHHTLEVRCLDIYMNERSENLTVGIQDFPEITLISPEDNETIVGDSADFIYNVTGDSATFTCELFVNGSLNETNISVENNTISTFSLSGLAEGSFEWYIECEDEEGNRSNSSHRTLNLSSPYPLVSLISPPDDYADIDGDVTLSFLVTDMASSQLSCSLWINDAPNQTNSAVPNNTETTFSVQSLSAGTHEWNVDCTNDLGKSSNSSKRILSVSYPSIQLQSPEDNGVDQDGNQSFWFTPYFGSETSLENCSVLLDGEANATRQNVQTGTPAEINASNLAYGEYTWSIECWLDENNRIESSHRKLTVLNTVPDSWLLDNDSLVDASILQFYVGQRIYVSANTNNLADGSPENENNMTIWQTDGSTKMVKGDAFTRTGFRRYEGSIEIEEGQGFDNVWAYVVIRLRADAGGDAFDASQMIRIGNPTIDWFRAYSDPGYTDEITEWNFSNGQTVYLEVYTDNLGDSDPEITKDDNYIETYMPLGTLIQSTHGVGGTPVFSRAAANTYRGSFTLSNDYIIGRWRIIKIYFEQAGNKYLMQTRFRVVG